MCPVCSSSTKPKRNLFRGSKQNMKPLSHERKDGAWHEEASRTFHFSSPSFVFFLPALSTVNRMLNMPLSYSWKGHTHVTHSASLSLSLFLSCTHVVCLYECVQRNPNPSRLSCGSNLFAEKFQEGEVINSHKFNLFIKHSLSGITAQTIIKEL